MGTVLLFQVIGKLICVGRYILPSKSLPCFVFIVGRFSALHGYAMGIGNILVLSQTTAYLLGFIFSFFLVIPMSVNLEGFKGHCLLYASGTWNTTSGLLEDITWGQSSHCNYVIFAGLLSLFVSFIFAARLSYVLFRDIDSSWLTAFLTLLANIVMALFFLISSSLLTTGFGEWCKLLLQKGSGITSCETADVLHFVDEKDVDTKEFFTQLGMAQFASWILWIFWTLQVVLSAVKLYKYSKQETFVTSMTRERERLLQRVNQNSYNPVT